MDRNRQTPEPSLLVVICDGPIPLPGAARLRIDEDEHTV